MEEMAAHLHELDPNHIVAMGTEGMEQVWSSCHWGL